MRKLKLDVNELAVEAFDTAATPPMRGTVEANQQYTYYCASEECTNENGTSCNWSLCYTCYTCPPVSPDPAICA
jgi:hypothetical protein